MESECRQEADHPVRHGSRCHDEGVMLGDRTAGDTIVAPGDPLEDSLRHEAGEMLAVDSSTSGLAGGDHPPALGEGQEAGVIGRRHV
jgi:hypothetical protein